MFFSRQKLLDLAWFLKLRQNFFRGASTFSDLYSIINTFVCVLEEKQPYHFTISQCKDLTKLAWRIQSSLLKEFLFSSMSPTPRHRPPPLRRQARDTWRTARDKYAPENKLTANTNQLAFLDQILFSNHILIRLLFLFGFCPQSTSSQ